MHDRAHIETTKRYPSCRERPRDDAENSARRSVTRGDIRTLCMPMDNQRRPIGVPPSQRVAMQRPRPPRPMEAVEVDRGDRRAPASGPVFLDRTGRRRRLLIVAGAAGATALVGAAIGLILGLTGASGHTLPGLPAATAHAHGPEAGRGSSTNAPAGNAGGAGQPTAAPAPPATSATAGPTVTPSHGSTHRHVPTQTPSHTKK